MSDWRALEEQVCSVRTKRCNETISKIIGGDEAKMPRVGVCLSGGGWRAMTSACALFDALSTPLAPSETISGEGGLKLMDTISHAFGLSGGSWALFTTLAGGDINPFHQPIDPRVTPMPHPWFHGRSNCFDENVHLYEGLAHMLSRDLVDRACYRSAAQQRVGFLSAKAGADTTIAAALTTDKLGTTLVERWGNFIANDILNFTDVRAGSAPNPATLAAMSADSFGSPPSSEPLPPAEGSGDSAKIRDAAILAQAKSNPSRNVLLGHLRGPIERGDLPFMVCSAIANRPRAAGESRPSPQSRAYDWVEFTPWFSRNPPQGVTVPITDRLGAYLEGPRTGTLVPLKMHHLMAICGSAFACDVACALPAGVSSLVQKHVNVSSEPILGGGISDVVELHDDASSGGIGQSIGCCRDAGIDFNVPLPPMLPEAGRSFDVIIVHDAGANSKNAFELQRAVELGYLQLMPGTVSPLEPFRAGEVVRVYRGVQGCPSVIYFLGLTERGTHQIVNSTNGLLKDVRKLRENVLKFLLPTLITELRVAKARLDHGGSATSTPAVGRSGPLNVVRSSQTRRAIRLEDEDEEDTDDAVRTASVSSLDATQSNAGVTMAATMNPLAEGLVTNAMMAGKIQDSWDAYLFLERALMDSVPLSKRVACIMTLQERAVRMLTRPPSELSAMDPISKSIDAPDLVDVFVEFGVMARIDPKNVAAGILVQREANLTCGWADYLAAAALLSASLPDENLVKEINRNGVPPACPPDALQALLPLTRSEQRDSKVWSLIFVGFQKLRQLPRLQVLLEHVVASQVLHLLQTRPLAEVEVEMIYIAETLVEACEELGSRNAVVQQLFASVCKSLYRGVASSPHDHVPFTASDCILFLACAASTKGRSSHLLQITLGTHRTPGADAASLNFESSPLLREANDAAGRERIGCILVDSVLKNASSILRNELRHCVAAAIPEAVSASNNNGLLTIEQCCKYGLPNALKEVIGTRLDDRQAVKVILEATDRHAAMDQEKNRAACVLEIWTNGVATNVFRDYIVETCVNEHQRYWMFLAPRVREVRVPPTATPEMAAEAVAFADKCKRLQLINIPGNLAHGVRSKLGELENRLLSRKDAVAAKITDVVGAVGDKAAAAKAIAVGKVAGLFGKFGK